MFTIKSIFEYVLKGVKDTRLYSEIKEILSPNLPNIEQAKLLSLYHDVKDIYEKGKQISELYIFDRVPVSLGTISGWDWKREHIMRAKITGFDSVSQKMVEQYVTVSSDTALNKEEWLKQLEEAGKSLFGRYDITPQKVTDFQYFIRKR